MDEDEEEDEQETEKAVLKLPPSLGDILSKKQNGSIDDAQEIRNNKLPVLDDQIKDYEEDFPNDKEKRGNIHCYEFLVVSEPVLDNEIRNSSNKRHYRLGTSMYYVSRFLGFFDPPPPLVIKSKHWS